MDAPVQIRRDAETLWDIEVIRRVRGLYCDIIDRIVRGPEPDDVDRLRQLFTEDCVLDFGPLLGKHDGREAIVRLFTELLPQRNLWMWHSIHSPVIDIDGDRATARWTIYAMATRRADPSAPPALTYGRYIDQYRRGGAEGWQLAHLLLLDETRRD